LHLYFHIYQNQFSKSNHIRNSTFSYSLRIQAYFLFGHFLIYQNQFSKSNRIRNSTFSYFSSPSGEIFFFAFSNMSKPVQQIISEILHAVIFLRHQAKSFSLHFHIYQNPYSKSYPKFYIQLFSTPSDEIFFFAFPNISKSKQQIKSYPKFL